MRLIGAWLAEHHEAWQERKYLDTDVYHVRIPAKLTDESDDDDRVVSRSAWGSDSSVVGQHGG